MHLDWSIGRKKFFHNFSDCILSVWFLSPMQTGISLVHEPIYRKADGQQKKRNGFFAPAPGKIAISMMAEEHRRGARERGKGEKNHRMLCLMSTRTAEECAAICCHNESDTV